MTNRHRGAWQGSLVLTCALAAMVCVPTVVRAQDADTLQGVAYVSEPHPEQYLDFYWPTNGARATVLFIHGGGLTESGERRTSSMYQAVCDPFVASGIACATIDYRLAPSFQWPAMPSDVASAMVRVRELVAERGGHPEQIFLFGHSSGCHLAALVATNRVHLEAVGLTSSDIAGVIAMGCVLDNYDAALRDLTADDIREGFFNSRSDESRFGTPENWIAANPSYFVGGHVPRTLVIVAEAERYFPPLLEQGARFVRRLLEEDVAADLVVVPGTHRSSAEALSEAGDPTFRAIREFIRVAEARDEPVR